MKNSFNRIIDLIDLNRNIVSIKDPEFGESFNNYKKKVSEEGASLEKAISLELFAITEVISKEVDKIYEELEKLTKEGEKDGI